MGRSKLWQKLSAAHARSFRQYNKPSDTSETPELTDESCLDKPEEVGVIADEGGWDGGVNHDKDTDNSDFSLSEGEDGEDEDEENEGVGKDLDEEGDEVARVNNMMQHEQLLIEGNPYQCNAFDHIMAEKQRSKDWKKAENGLKSRGVYTGASKRTEQRKDKKERDKAVADEAMRNTKGAAMMKGFITVKKVPKKRKEVDVDDETGLAFAPELPEPTRLDLRPIFTGYLSDIEEDEAQLEDEQNLSEKIPESEEIDSPSHPNSSITPSSSPENPTPSFHISKPPPLKRRRHEVPLHLQREKARLERRKRLEGALVDIEKRITGKKSVFVAGREGLQASRTRAIRSYLEMVLKNGRKGIDASQRAAEANGFAEKWGGRLVRQWVKAWVNFRELPTSSRGSHIKSFSLLEDPVIRAELRSFIRSNKWAVEPAKIAEFSKTTMIPAAASKFIQQAVREEMPRGLKQYMELELFPRIQQKVVKGISLETARQFLRKEGFRYVEHKKGLYYDGHERPDVVAYRQNVFIPELNSYRYRIVEYNPQDLTQLVVKPRNFVERQLVLVPQDEMTAQANDGRKKIVGHMPDAGQSLEYGKNYEGYWTGELFVKQLKEKIIPEFERLHGPGYQALILVDNSQGHCAYAEDALLVSRMNLKPGGKQPRMRQGWYLDKNGQRVMQDMVFPEDHPDYPNEPKGVKQVLVERGLWKAGLTLGCKDSASCSEGGSCCAKRILEAQPDFQGQRSLVQEVIEAAGHVCLILPKFHCELNFIEHHQENMPKALASVDVILIRKWQNRMMRWVDAYHDGLNVTDAQAQVQLYSSTKFASHRRVSETV
ncbi:hypothetical protein CVT24_013261, partial [Panaeolus cyanescens]